MEAPNVINTELIPLVPRCSNWFPPNRRSCHYLQNVC